MDKTEITADINRKAVKNACDEDIGTKKHHSMMGLLSIEAGSLCHSSGLCVLLLSEIMYS